MINANFIFGIVCENNGMKRILLVKTSSLGDVIHNLPVVNDILQHYPNAQIDWLVEESFADIPRLHPGVNQVLTVAIRRWRKQLFKCATWQQIRALKRTLSTREYDAIIDTQGLIKSALIAGLANGVRHGYDADSIREPWASRCYQQVYRISYQQHAVIRNRTLAAHSLGYAVPTSAPDYGIQASSVQLPAEVNLTAPFVIGLHGTSRDSKLWDEANWIALGQQLQTQGVRLVLPWSNPAEQQRAQRIQAQLSMATVLPRLSIHQLAGVISHAQAAIGVDTGLSHLAAALNIPTVAIYTDTDPTLTGVMAGAHRPAINLGNIHQPPAVAAVLNAYQAII